MMDYCFYNLLLLLMDFFAQFIGVYAAVFRPNIESDYKSLW